MRKIVIDSTEDTVFILTTYTACCGEGGGAHVCVRVLKTLREALNRMMPKGKFEQDEAQIQVLSLKTGVILTNKAFTRRFCMTVEEADCDLGSRNFNGRRWAEVDSYDRLLVEGSLLVADLDEDLDEEQP